MLSDVTEQAEAALAEARDNSVTAGGSFIN
jgi:hypothetical protein